MADPAELARAQLLAISYRGPVAEASHWGQIAACLPSGQLVAGWGDPEALVVLRSAAKPLQALSVVTSGAAARFGLEPRHLALCSGSHTGSAAHLRTVREIMERIGLDEIYLGCGTHLPDDSAEAHRLQRDGLCPTPFHNNCSGKHAGMLATALALGARPEGYLDPRHPVQKLIREHLAAFSDMPEDNLLPLPDGCGAPTYALPLCGVATAFARLGRPQGLPEDLRDAADQVTHAIRLHPEMVRGAGCFNTELIEQTEGRVIAKGGAEGLFALAVPAEGLGVAVKVADGGERCWPPVVLTLLGSRLGPLPDALAAAARAEQTNCHETVVGQVEPAEGLATLIPLTLPREETTL
ncbi:MAG TPA: asparaginase [Armatimonadota bacterium]|jgi:L-asparaginase II